MLLNELIQRLQAIEKEYGGEIKCFVDDEDMATEVKEAKSWRQFEIGACVIIE